MVTADSCGSLLSHDSWLLSSFSSLHGCRDGEGNSGQGVSKSKTVDTGDGRKTVAIGGVGVGGGEWQLVRIGSFQSCKLGTVASGSPGRVSALVSTAHSNCN